MTFRPYYYDDHGCAAYVFGCGTLGVCAVVDARLEDVEGYRWRRAGAHDRRRLLLTSRC
jgi:hypothetical protein